MLFHNTCFRVSQLLLLLAVLIMPLTLSAEDISVSFSVSGGFYDHPFSLSLSCPEGYVIHYTTNGNTPKPTDPQYISPLELNKSLYSRSNIYTIQTCADSLWYVPDTIQRCIVIRAAAFDAEGNQKSTVVTNSYFIKSLGIDLHNLPVISLCSDSLSLFDYETGILVPGITGSNYQQHGREWERLCNFEFYETDNKGINQQGGLRTHGKSTRNGVQKSLKLYARKEYGNKCFNYKFFESTDINAFKHLVLKPAKPYLCRDYICTQIAQPLNFETPCSRPVVVFLNGEYWGLYFLKERPDNQFIEDHFGYDKHEVNIIESWTGDVSEGSNENFVEMMQWLMKADLSNTKEYEYVCSLIDINSFIDYYCFALFIGILDWPAGNMRCYQWRDGKWRWIFFDGDYSLDGSTNIFKNTLYNNENKDKSTLLFKKLFSNEEFRDQFYERFGQLLIKELHPNLTQQYYEECISTIHKELDSQFNRFYDYETIKDNTYLKNNLYVGSFLSSRVINVASALYQLYYKNNWVFHKSKSKSQSHFKYKPGSPRPTFLLRMARQFRDWNYVKLYTSYERSRIRDGINASSWGQSMKQSWVWRKLKGTSSQ